MTATPPLPCRNRPCVSSDNYLGGGKDARGDDSEDIEAESEEDELDLNDPLAVRKSRDLNLERKRVSELNEWEIKARDPEIAGMLKKEKAKELLARAEAALEAEAASSAAARPRKPKPMKMGTIPNPPAPGRKGRKKDKPVETLARIVPAAADFEAPVPLKRKSAGCRRGYGRCG